MELGIAARQLRLELRPADALARSAPRAPQAAEGEPGATTAARAALGAGARRECTRSDAGAPAGGRAAARLARDGGGVVGFQRRPRHFRRRPRLRRRRAIAFGKRLRASRRVVPQPSVALLLPQRLTRSLEILLSPAQPLLALSRLVRPLIQPLRFGVQVDTLHAHIFLRNSKLRLRPFNARLALEYTFPVLPQLLCLRAQLRLALIQLVHHRVDALLAQRQVPLGARILALELHRALLPLTRRFLALRRLPLTLRHRMLPLHRRCKLGVGATCRLGAVDVTDGPQLLDLQSLVGGLDGGLRGSRARSPPILAAPPSQ